MVLAGAPNGHGRVSSSEERHALEELVLTLLLIWVTQAGLEPKSCDSKLSSFPSVTAASH